MESKSWLQLLDSMRYQGDPLADKAIESVVREHGANKLKSANAYSSVEGLAKQGDKECTEFLAFYDRDPPWLKDSSIPWVSRFRDGRRFFVRNAPSAGLALMYGSLIALFAVNSENKVLLKTGRLSHYGDVQRRIFETLAFVKDIVLCEDIKDIKRTVCKVRLLHAQVRYFIKNSCGTWNSLEHGEPVNQEDQLATLLAFSIAVIKGLRKLGIQGSNNEHNNYLLLWKFVGHYLGVHENLLCDTMSETSDLSDIIKQRLCHPDEASQNLTNALLTSFTHRMPFYLSFSVSSQLSRYIIDDERIANGLGLEKVTFSTKVVINLLYGFNIVLEFLQHYIGPFENLLYKFGRKALTSLVEVSLHNNKPSFTFKTLKPN
ncbi:rubber oxygenase isoform X2 [Nematostella vectensis]|uniref:rubber oxygenase isoform X2 n=1 Tax=Nematostella vectensis TaxID=45351 RepID=UPI0020779407|nr:rubber oxygenase isoform X2 [Nematostella vectensis]